MSDTDRLEAIETGLNDLLRRVSALEGKGLPPSGGLPLSPDPKPKFRNVLTVVRCWRDAVGEMNAMFATADGVQYEFWWDSKAGRWKPGNGYSETLLNERFVEYHNLVSAWDVWCFHLPRVETAE